MYTNDNDGFQFISCDFFAYNALQEEEEMFEELFKRNMIPVVIIKDRNHRIFSDFVSDDVEYFLFTVKYKQKKYEA